MGNKAARKTRLTDANARKFRPEESEYTVWDTKTPGLGVRIKPSGYRVWVYHESTSGRPRRHSLGPVSLKTVEEARQMCLKLRVRQENGNSSDTSPDVPGNVKIPDFGEFVAGEWKAAHYDRMKPSTRKSVDSYLKTQLLPNFGKLPLSRITRSRICRWFDEFSSRAPGGANRALDNLSGILSHAIVCGQITVNPTRDIRRNPKRKMTRFLSGKEIRRLHATLDAHVAECPIDGPKADIVRLLLFTGCRRGEILGLRWSEVGEDVLELADSKTGPRTVFLSPDAKAVIERQPGKDSPWVFPSPLDRKKSCSVDYVGEFWRMVRKRTGIEDVRLHDLRHSVASQAVLRGVPLPVVARLLGHSQMSMTLRYAHVAEREIEAAAERVGCVIAGMC